MNIYKDNISKELEKQIISAQLTALGVKLSTIDTKRANFIHGADHGQGAFQAGSKVYWYNRGEVHANCFVLVCLMCNVNEWLR